MEKIDKLKPGERADVSIPVFIAKGKKYIYLNYGDEYGNTYQTRVLVDFDKLKVLKQEYRKVKVVEDVGDNIPILEIDEESLQMVMNTKDVEIVKKE